MIKCKKCGRQTERGETTGLLITSRKKKYENGTIGKQMISSIKVCNECEGEN